MKAKLLLLVVAALGAACSAPKSTFYFSYHDYQAGKKAAQLQEIQLAQQAMPSNEVASTETTLITDVAAPAEKPLQPTTVNTPLKTKAQQKALIKEVKQHVKAAAKQVKKMSPPAPQGMDNDLKMAAIFGAIGIGLGLLFGVSEIIGFVGFVAIVVALFFLIRWLLRQ